MFRFKYIFKLCFFVIIVELKKCYFELDCKNLFIDVRNIWILRDRY